MPRGAHSREAADSFLSELLRMRAESGVPTGGTFVDPSSPEARAARLWDYVIQQATNELGGYDARQELAGIDRSKIKTDPALRKRYNDLQARAYRQPSGDEAAASVEALSFRPQTQMDVYQQNVQQAILDNPAAVWSGKPMDNMPQIPQDGAMTQRADPWADSVDFREIGGYLLPFMKQQQPLPRPGAMPQGPQAAGAQPVAPPQGGAPTGIGGNRMAQGAPAAQTSLAQAPNPTAVGGGAPGVGGGSGGAPGTGQDFLRRVLGARFGG